MNVYDWDDTIYKGDSTVHFVFYAWRKCPKTLLNLPRTVVFGIGYGLHICKKQTFKENLYHMYVYIKDIDSFIDEYTTNHLKNVKQWYKEQQKEDDVVISASNEFMIRSFCDKVGIKYVMASPVNKKTGKYEGLNCHGEEKVRRFYEMFPQGQIDEFYSDSLSDTPLANISKQAFIVKDDERTKWPR